MRILTCLALLLLHPAIASASDAEDADAVAAAKLLFGVGLKIDIDPTTAKVRVAFDPSGDLDDARVRRLIAEYLAPQVESARTSYSFNADFQIFLTDYHAAAQAGGDAWVLAEPTQKREICKSIAEYKVKDQEASKELLDWCTLTAARLARHSLHEFRGQPVESSGNQLYNGTLLFKDKLFTETGYVLIVPGVPGKNNVQTMRVQENMLSTFPEENRYYGEAAKIHAQNQAWIKDKEAAVAAQNAKLGGRGGNVVWGPRFFGRWDPVEPVTSFESCNQPIFWEAFGPTKVAGGAVFVWEMSVDGAVCATDFIQSRRIAAGGPFFTGGSGDCSAPLVAPGKHTLKVQLWATRDQKTGRLNVEIQSDRAVVSDEIRSARTKVVAAGAMTCQSPEGLRVTARE